MNDWTAKFNELKERDAIIEWAKTAPIESIVEVLLKEPLSPKHSHLMMGMPIDHFRKLIQIQNPAFIEILNHETHLEPTQLQLSLLFKVWSEEINQFTKEQLQILKSINQLPLETLTHAEILTIQEQIIELKRHMDLLSYEINQGLKLGWNSGRVELIETGSLLKEVILRLKSQAIPSLETFLKLRLESVFGPNDGKPGLSDGDEVEEGLAKIGLWELSDFYSCGMDPQQFTSLDSILQFLKEKGLKTVSDLKAHSIYSKPLFNYFIADFKSLKT